ncbi:hypothetical protein [Psychromarinibacter halotolerans]|uniref:Uncharacterized protein n=1 Tax=Psychromarinibacter halotolerans TaxID=1775175 RepID=A0ABV7GPA0_9RHOB|nr:hypothetical protein [Psychromarinibacter halotolerans]MDF0596967.1 hypothetical protein [Psychromarinibacter halotolerans]
MADEAVRGKYCGAAKCGKNRETIMEKSKGSLRQQWLMPGELPQYLPEVDVNVRRIL